MSDLASLIITKDKVQTVSGDNAQTYLFFHLVQWCFAYRLIICGEMQFTKHLEPSKY